MESRIAERLGDNLIEWAESVDNDEHDSFYDDHLLDDLLLMHEVLHKRGVTEGRKLQRYSLICDHPISIFETIEIDRFLSGKKDKVQVLSILNIKPKDENFLIEFLGGLV